ncbi:MAG TPA: hypothetical protein VFW40_01495 [Capsulimonadaceae bacterium]|nr:hypothetical protein [Capsulimonadaceae bacterium]
MISPNASDTITRVCEALSNNNAAFASRILQDEMPFAAHGIVNRNYPKHKVVALFVRDGFIDRYSGKRLLFSPALRLISSLIPEDFPYHLNWKTTECHAAYWNLSATLDHIVPVVRGGSNDDSNLATTSMIRNNAKSNWTLEELGWRLLPPGNFENWDGMLGWFCGYIEQHPGCETLKYASSWYGAAKKVLESR